MTTQTHRFRTTDPETSRLAAQRAEASGSIACARQRILETLASLSVCSVSPDDTASEIADHSVSLGRAVDRYTVSRRLPEMERDGLVERHPARVCRVSGTLQTTWRLPCDPDRSAA